MPGKFLAPAAVEGVEGLGHNVCGARAAVSPGVGLAVAGPACEVHHGQALEGRVESLTVDPAAVESQGPAVIKNSG